LIWNQEQYLHDVPHFKRWAPNFIARAIYDGAVTHRYITDAEVSNHAESKIEEELLQSVLDILQVKPIDYHIKNLWNSSASNEELNLKIKSMIGDYLQNYEMNEVGAYVRELKC